MNESLNVFYAIGRYFVTYFSVSVTSLMENNRHLDLNIFLIYDFEENELLDEIIAFSEQKYNRKIHLIFRDSAAFDHYRVARHVSKNTYLRLLLADVIPANVPAGLFLDADTVVTGSLIGLAELQKDLISSDDDDDHPSVFAVEEIPEQTTANSSRISSLGFKTNKYFNAGIMMINLRSWRRDNISARLIEMTNAFMDHLLYWDQDVLNMFFVNRWTALDPTYNALHLIWKLPTKPLIIHYAGSSKPWNYLDRHPYKAEYFRYLKLTPFNHMKYVDYSAKKMPYKYYRDARHFLNYFRQLALGNIKRANRAKKL